MAAVPRETVPPAAAVPARMVRVPFITLTVAEPREMFPPAERREIEPPVPPL